MTSTTEWESPEKPNARARLSWQNLLWALIYPARRQRVGVTLPGLILIALSMGIGSAAYSTANNILFLTLSLLLACLILSGVLSWLNFRKLSWRLHADLPMRVGQAHAFAIEVRNGKKVLPTYGVWFEVTSTSLSKPLKLPLRGRLDPLEEVRLEFTLSPQKRGRERIQVAYVGSLFPFGFLKKSLTASLHQDVLVWAAPVEYRRFAVTAWHRFLPGASVARRGQSGDLFALRKFQTGDSHRQIHWKASARLRQLLVRQFAAESEEGFSLWLQTPADVWTRPEQFELLCSLAATLAEDLFLEGKLHAVAVNDGALVFVRRVRDLEAFLDEVAAVVPMETSRRASLSAVVAKSESAQPWVHSSPTRSSGKLLTFAADGARGVGAFLDGEKAASA